MEPELHGADAGVSKCSAASDAFVRVDEFTARGVPEHPVALASEHLPDGLVLRTAKQVPDRNLDDPVTTVVKVDGLDDPVNGLRVDLDPDEQALEQLAIGHAVAARVPLDAVVGADDDDRGLLERPRDRDPRQR